MKELSFLAVSRVPVCIKIVENVLLFFTVKFTINHEDTVNVYFSSMHDLLLPTGVAVVLIDLSYL